MKRGKQADTYYFEGILESLPGSSHTLVLLPREVIDALPPKGKIRVKGTMNGTPFALAVQHLKDGSRYFIVGGTLRREAKLRKGDQVKTSFYLVDPDLVELPEELEAVLAQDEEGNKAFGMLTKGLQRGLAHYVNSVKNTDSRIKRAIEIVEKTKTRNLHAMKPKNKE